MAAPTALNMRCSLGSAASLSCRRSAKCTRRAAAVAPLAAVREIFMPALSSTMTEGKIVSWLKSEGDKARALGPHQHCFTRGQGATRTTLRPRARLAAPLRVSFAAWLCSLAAWLCARPRLTLCAPPRLCSAEKGRGGGGGGVGQGGHGRGDLLRRLPGRHQRERRQRGCRGRAHCVHRGDAGGDRGR